MSEGGRARHVTGRVDPCCRRAQPRVDDHVAAVGQLDRDPLEREVICPGPATGSDEERIGLKRLAVDIDDEGVTASGMRDLGADAHLDAIRDEPGVEDRGCVGVVARKQARRGFEQRHATAEPRERLAKLTADRTTTDQHQPTGQLLEIPHRVGCQRRQLGESLHGRQRRLGAGRDQRTVESEIPIAGVRGDADRAVVDEAAVAVHDGHALARETFRGVVWLDRRDRPSHVCHHAGEVDARLARIDAEARGVAGALCSVGGGDQALGGDTASPEAIAADARLLDEAGPRADRRGAQSGDQAGGTAAEDDEVVGHAVFTGAASHA